MSDRVKCKKCSNMILPETAALYAGKCAVCAKPKPKPSLPKKINTFRFLTEVDLKKYDQVSVHERLSALTAAQAERYEQLQEIPMHLRSVYVTDTIEQQAANGGLAQAFANVPSLFDHAVGGYLELGLEKSADIMGVIASILPSEVALKRDLGVDDGDHNLEVFQKYLEGSKLKTMDGVFYEEFGLNADTRLSYVIRNREIFSQL